MEGKMWKSCLSPASKFNHSIQVASQLLISQPQLGISTPNMRFMDLMLQHEERNINYSLAE